jgi:hypothetical protein
MKETIRDVVAGELTLDYFMKRSAEGWKLASVEWTRDSEKAQAVSARPHVLTGWADVPYGLQVAQDGVHLEENSLETTVLLLILEQIVKEKRIHEIAWQLNMQGYSTRDGRSWSASDVFNMLPRLIEAGPTLLKSAVWQQRRPAPPITQ